MNKMAATQLTELNLLNEPNNPYRVDRPTQPIKETQTTNPLKNLKIDIWHDVRSMDDIVSFIYSLKRLVHLANIKNTNFNTSQM